jgi:UDP-N-acetylglucosamine/UDP-N-acetylgalactosamine diphosphorylase
MKREGVESISYFHVDNPLVRPVDPTFIGFHVLGGSEMSSKTALKAYSHEKIGTFCRDGNGIRVIEYSDLPESLGEARGKDGRLKFHAGSVGIHILNRNFVERITSGKSDTYALPFHRAEKIVDTIDDAGRPVIPKTANAIKFEMFLFDAIPFARNPVIVETDRRDEFSPVKNSVGIDSAESCRADLLRMWTRWLCAAGEHIRCDDTGLPEAVFEVDPLFADDAETFVKKWRSLRSRPEIRDGTVVE